MPQSLPAHRSFSEGVSSRLPIFIATGSVKDLFIYEIYYLIYILLLWCMYFLY
jgi:hypothetical protein